jgi:hypothetical protein
VERKPIGFCALVGETAGDVGGVAGVCIGTRFA